MEPDDPCGSKDTVSLKKERIEALPENKEGEG